MYRQKRPLRHYATLDRFAEAIGPVLSNYRLAFGYRREDYVDRDAEGNLMSRRRIFGDRLGAHLEHFLSSGEEIVPRIEISRHRYTNDDIEL